MAPHSSLPGMSQFVVGPGPLLEQSSSLGDSGGQQRSCDRCARPSLSGLSAAPLLPSAAAGCWLLNSQFIGYPPAGPAEELGCA